MYLGRIVEIEFVPGFLINYEKQSDGERSDAGKLIFNESLYIPRLTGVKHIRNFTCIFNEFFTSSDGMKTATKYRYDPGIP